MDWNCSRRVWVFFLSVLLLTGCRSPVRDIVHEPAGVQRFEPLLIGLCEDYPEESRTLEEAHRDLLVVKTNGFSVLRIAFGWDAMEPQKGIYDWSFWDDFVAMANAMDVRLIPYICYTPQWAARDPQHEQFWTQPPRDMQDFTEFLDVLVQSETPRPLRRRKDVGRIVCLVPPTPQPRPIDLRVRPQQLTSPRVPPQRDRASLQVGRPIVIVLQ